MHASLVFAAVAFGLTAAADTPTPNAPEEHASDQGAAPQNAPESAELETVVRDQPGRKAPQRRLDAENPGFASALDVEHEATARSSDGLAEVLAQAPGATVRSIGGLGQWSSVSVRGSTAQQVGVFFDGVPQDSNTAGMLSLSDLPLDTLGVVQVYRGYVPVSFGSAAIGGAINLVSRDGGGAAQAVAQTGIGSFGGRELLLGFKLPLWDGQDAPRLTTRVGYAGATGDFAFYDTHHTPDIDSDNGLSTRSNNDYERLLGQVRLAGILNGFRYSVQTIGLAKRQGIPGPADAQSTRSRLDTLTAKLIGNARRPALGPGGYFEIVSGLTVGAQHFTDPLGEVGYDRDDEVDQTLDLYVSPRLRTPLWRGAYLLASIDLRYEQHQVQSAFDGDLTTGDASRTRGSYGAGVELSQFLFSGRLHLAASTRLDANDSRFRVLPGEGEVFDAGRDRLTWGVSPRAAVRFTVWDGLSLRSSIGRYYRPPTVLELFGDRGAMVGNEGLVPEQGLNLDAGAIWDTRQGPVSLYAASAFFAGLSEQLIVWVPSMARVRPVNLSSAQILGVESALMLSAWEERWELAANYTWQDSQNQNAEVEQRGKPLPGRPRHELFARTALGERIGTALGGIEARVFYTFDYLAESFLDVSGRLGLPPRAIHGLGIEARLWPAAFPGLHARLAVEVRNVLDVIAAPWQPPYDGARPRWLPVSDFIGYPLPGRSVWLSFRVSTREPAAKDSLPTSENSP